VNAGTAVANRFVGGDVLVEPVPEPTSLALVATLLIGMAALRRRLC